MRLMSTLKFDRMLDPTPTAIGASVKAAHADGVDGGWVIETRHDPFLLLGSAAAQRTGLNLGTAVAVGFARSPMTLAQMANDLQSLTEGKFSLGLGTQVKAHIERRFSMPWGKPVARMREMVRAIHSIWAVWDDDSNRLAFTGEYYQHTLMSPAFSPGPNPFGRPQVLLGALGPAMTELAGQVADGLVVHRFMSQRFLDEVTLPALEKGLANRLLPLKGEFELVYPPFVASGKSPEELEQQIDAVRSQIAFYASTPSYQPLLDLHGWTAIGHSLQEHARHREWERMANLVSDEMLESLAVVTTPADARSDLEKRFQGKVSRVVRYQREKAHVPGS